VLTDRDNKVVRDPVYRHLFLARSTSVTSAGAPTAGAPERSRQTADQPARGSDEPRSDVALGLRARAAYNQLATTKSAGRAAQASSSTTGNTGPLAHVCANCMQLLLISYQNRNAR